MHEDILVPAGEASWIKKEASSTAAIDEEVQVERNDAIVTLKITAETSPPVIDSTFRSHKREDHVRMWSKSDAGSLELVLQTKKRGWLLFGLSEMGSTIGADIMLARVDPDGNTAHVHDMFSTREGEVQVDTCSNDWHMVSGSRHEGETTMHLRRKLDTHDPYEDRAVRCDQYSHIVYDSGFGTIADPLAAAKALLQAVSKRHRENQFMFGTTDIVLCGKDPLDDVKAESEELQLLNKIQIPPVHTTVMCHGFKIEGSGHIIAMRPKITYGSPVHHFHLHRCRNNAYFRKYRDTPQLCSPPSFEKTQLESQCVGSAYTYVAGQSGPFILPKDVGINIGDDVDVGDIRYMILEIHYDNPKHVAHLKDESGIQLWRAHSPRKYSASAMILGDPFAELYAKDNDKINDRAKKKGIPPDRKSVV